MTFETMIILNQKVENFIKKKTHKPHGLHLKQKKVHTHFDNSVFW